MKRFIMIFIILAMMLTLFATPAYATLTPGYWKNHVENWDRYLVDPPLPDENFINGPEGFTWLNALGTPPPKGDPWYILARAYSASYLNGMSYWGTEVSDDMGYVEWLLTNYGPGEFVKGTDEYLMAKYWATTLDNWNNDIWD